MYLKVGLQFGQVDDFPPLNQGECIAVEMNEDFIDHTFNEGMLLPLDLFNQFIESIVLVEGVKDIRIVIYNFRCFREIGCLRSFNWRFVVAVVRGHTVLFGFHL